MHHDKYLVKGKGFSLSGFDTKDKGGFADKKEAKEQMDQNLEALNELQERLYAEGKWGLVVILQAIDTAGKDGMISHVMGGFNPQGTLVTSFKVPNSEEIAHDYLWRVNKALPRRGNIAIFNRSHYEDVLVVRVHDLLKSNPIPQSLVGEDIWEQRFRQINDYERYLAENGFAVVKFFLYISKEEQARRQLARIEEPDKNWKFSAGDIKERGYWDQYQKAYEDMLAKTSTEYAPWYIIPSDRKWYSRYLVSSILRKTLERLNPQYPVMDEAAKTAMEDSRKLLLSEGVVYKSSKDDGATN